MVRWILCVLVLIECAHAHEFLYPVFNDHKWAFINEQARVVTGYDFDVAYACSEQRCPITIGDRSGFIDFDGSLKIPAGFANVTPFCGGLAKVQGLDQKRGVIDLEGKTVVPLQYAQIEIGCDGPILVKRTFEGNTWEFLNRTGQPLSPRLAKEITSLNGISGGLIAARTESAPNAWAFGYIDYEGQSVIRPKYLRADHFSEDRAFVLVDFGRLGLIDSSGKILAEFKSEKADQFSHGFAAIQIGTGRTGPHVYVDRTGTIAIEGPFRVAGRFSEGLAGACVENNGLCGYLDIKGKWVIPPQFVSTEPFQNGLAAVRLPKRFPPAYVNRSGQIVWK